MLIKKTKMIRKLITMTGMIITIIIVHIDNVIIVIRK